MNQKLGQLAFLAFLVCIPVFVFYDIATRFITEGVASGSAENNAAMYPRLVAALLLILLVIQAVRTLFGPAQGPAVSTGISLAGLKKYRSSVGVFVAFLIYLSAFRWFGFMISTPVFLIATQLLLGFRKPLQMVLYSAGVTAAIWLAFAKILNLVLPSGDVFG